MLHLARFLMGGLMVYIQIVGQETLQHMVLLAYLAGVVQALLCKSHAPVLLVLDVTLRREDLDHLAHAGWGYVHELGKLGGLGGTLAFSQPEDADKVVFTVSGCHWTLIRFKV